MSAVTTDPSDTTPAPGNNGDSNTSAGRNGGDQPAADATSTFKEHLAGLVTIGALTALTIFIIYLLRRVGSADLAWSRRVYLLSGVEAIAFAAVGWLFGKEVHRGEAQTAKAQTASANKRANAAQDDAKQSAATAAAEKARGHALAAAVKASAGSQPEPQADALLGVTGASFTSALTHFDSLSSLADRLYPDA